MVGWKPPDTPMGATPPAGGGWQPPDTPWKPPDTLEGGSAPPGWGADAAARVRERAKPFAAHFDDEGGFHLFGTSTEPMGSFFGSTVAPAINIMDYPIRAAIGDLAVAASVPGSPAWFAHRWGLGPDVSPEKMQKLKEQITTAGALPTTRVGQAVEDIASLPGTLISKGVGAASRSILGDKLTEQLSPYAQAAADVLPFGAGKFLSRAPREPPLPLKPSERWAEVGRRVKEKQDIANENRARKDMSDTFARSSYEGGPNAQDISDRMAEARRAGQPLTVADLNQSLQRVLGNLYRQGGAAAGRISSFLGGRDAGAAARMETAVDASLTDQSLRDAMKKQAAERSVDARPIWAEAMERPPPTAVFEHQYQAAWTDSLKAQDAARAKVAAAEAAQTKLRAQRITTTHAFEPTPMTKLVEGREGVREGKFFETAPTTTGGFERADQAATAKVQGARQELEEATQHTERLKRLLQAAQQDGTLDHPNAVWSPGLQRLLDRFPGEIGTGIKKGVADMTREAAPDIVAGRPFNPRDYAIVGMDEAGAPIIGQVPTMRAWHAAKMGIDAFLRSPAAHDELTGRLNNTGRTYTILRNALVEELDRLNPKYKPAREQWAGQTAVIEATNEGRFAFDRKHFMDDQHLREHFDSLGESEKQGFIIGTRQAISDMMDEVTARRDQSVTFDKPRVQKRLAAILGEDGAKTLLDAAEREHLTKTTSNVTTKGSATQGRAVTDAEIAAERMKTMRRVLEHVKSGHPVRAITSGVGGAIEKAVQSRLGDRARARQDIVNDIMARHLIDPNLALNPTGPLLSPVPGPPRTFPSPAMAYTFGTSLMPEDRSKHP